MQRSKVIHRETSCFAIYVGSARATSSCGVFRCTLSPFKTAQWLNPSTLNLPTTSARHLRHMSRQVFVKLRLKIHASAREPWQSFTVPDNYLRLSQTLQSGQSFRWVRTGERDHPLSATGAAEEWVGSIEQTLYVLRQTVPRPPADAPDPVWYRVVTPSGERDAEDAGSTLRDYFRADTDFREMYNGFCKADEDFATIFPYFNGLRTLRQPPEEAFLAFICSSNNHIARISGMVTRLAETFGESIGTFEGREYYAFPKIEKMSAEVEEQALRDDGFGYRAKFLSSSAKALALHAKAKDTNVRDMLLSWRDLDRLEVTKLLTRYPGVGRKVAGCIALTSLDKLGEIPVDTHVWNVAKRYRPELGEKSLTSRVYEDIGDWFRERFGEDVAGIAHNFLFVGELPAFKKLLPVEQRGSEDAGEEADDSGDKKKMKVGTGRKALKTDKTVLKKTTKSRTKDVSSRLKPKKGRKPSKSNSGLSRSTKQ